MAAAYLRCSALGDDDELVDGRFGAPQLARSAKQLAHGRVRRSAARSIRTARSPGRIGRSRWLRSRSARRCRGHRRTRRRPADRRRAAAIPSTRRSTGRRDRAGRRSTRPPRSGRSSRTRPVARPAPTSAVRRPLRRRSRDRSGRCGCRRVMRTRHRRRAWLSMPYGPRPSGSSKTAISPVAGSRLP